MKRFFSFSLLATLFAPFVASAHEVYVLTPGQISEDLAKPPFDMVAVLLADMHLFVFWAFIGILMVMIVFLISISRRFENAVDPMLMKLKKHAPFVSRVTIGLAFLAAAFFGASYGPELPFLASFGAYTPLIVALFVVTGILITIGLYTRIAAGVALLIFLANVYFHGEYMLTYANYLGEILVLLILGAHTWGLDTLRHGKKPGAMSKYTRMFAPFAFMILRVSFGISLLYASIYAKFLHNHLALQVASGQFGGHALSLAQTLGFEPHFLVLGAGIVEIVIGLFFLLGIEIRFTALFLEFWLALSLYYFGETVWPHLVLIGIPIAFIFYGYDKYSLEGLFFKRGKREPVL
ncbi:MAG: hypothetical protein JWN64_86 [Parcubacteria group bacterium]|nr:hypothetical protein [Parcubacteria group bacterium]